MRFSSKHACLAVALLFLAAAPAAVQAANDTTTPVSGQKAATDAGKSGGEDTAQTEKIEEIERKIETLAEELQKLREGDREPAPADATEAAAGRRSLGPAAGKVYGKDHGVSLGGYGEVLYEDFDGARDDGTPSGQSARADMLRAVVYLGYKFSDRFVFNSEIEFEHGTTDGSGEVSVEFAYVDALLDPRFNGRVGQVLVPMGLVNEMHEPPTFLGSRRPVVEQVVLPSTWSEVGLGVYGDVGPFSYRAYVMPGLESSGFTASSGIREGRQGGSKSAAGDTALTARLDWTATPGLLAGASWYQGDSGQGAVVEGQTFDATVTAWDVHADWKWRGLWLRGVLAEVEVDDADIVSVQTEEVIGSRISGWYVDVGYDVLSATRFNRHALIPFVRQEEFDTQDEVPPGSLADPANDRELTTYGVVYKPLPQLAFKLDYQDAKNAANTAVDQWNAAVGFYF